MFLFTTHCMKIETFVYSSIILQLLILITTFLCNSLSLLHIDNLFVNINVCMFVKLGLLITVVKLVFCCFTVQDEKIL